MQTRAVLLYIIIQCCCCWPIQRQNNDIVNMRSEQTQINYLKRYAYLKSNKGEGVTGRMLLNAIVKFQRKWGLKETGKIDAATQKLMEKGRCGVPDDIDEDSSDITRQKRYVKSGYGEWADPNLTYKIVNYTLQISRVDLETLVQKALDSWGENTLLTFIQESGAADIDILFLSGDHGDPYPFDGSGGQIGHAYPPDYGGDAHFDEDEMWTVNAGPYSQSFDLYYVLLHEFGHSLGLGHSENRDAIMYPFYEYTENVQLHEDDVAGIQSIYGQKTSSNSKDTTTASTATTSSTTTFAASVFCGDTPVDAMFSDKAGTIYAFKGPYIAKVDPFQGIASGYPKRISEKLKQTPISDFDAAVYLPSLTETCCIKAVPGREVCSTVDIEGERIYLFKGDQYYIIHNGVLVNGDSAWSGKISDRFPGVPNNITAAYTINGNEIYFVKYDKLYKIIRDKGHPSVDQTKYPESLTDIAKLPNTVDAVVTVYDGDVSYTYYFSGTQYYRISNDVSETDSKSQWFNC